MIVVCGEALIDLIPDGDGTFRPMPGGGPFNAALALARLEVPTSFLGRLSTDRFGCLLADRLARDGVDLSLASRGCEPPTLAVAAPGGGGAPPFQLLRGTTARSHPASPALPP